MTNPAKTAPRLTKDDRKAIAARRLEAALLGRVPVNMGHARALTATVLGSAASWRKWSLQVNNHGRGSRVEAKSEARKALRRVRDYRQEEQARTLP